MSTRDFTMIFCALFVTLVMVAGVVDRARAQDAGSSAHGDTLGSYLPLAGGELSGNLDLNGNDLLITPTGSVVIDGGEGANVFSVKISSVEEFRVTSSTTTFSNNLNMGSGQFIYSSAGALDIGSACTTPLGAAGDACFFSDVEVQGGLNFDSVSGDPCGTYEVGAVFHNVTSDYFCFCNSGGADKQVHSPATDCF